MAGWQQSQSAFTSQTVADRQSDDTHHNTSLFSILLSPHLLISASAQGRLCVASTSSFSRRRGSRNCKTFTSAFGPHQMWSSVPPNTEVMSHARVNFAFWLSGQKLPFEVAWDVKWSEVKGRPTTGRLTLMFLSSFVRCLGTIGNKNRRGWISKPERLLTWLKLNWSTSRPHLPVMAFELENCRFEFYLQEWTAAFKK